MKSIKSSKAWVLGPKAENQEIFEKMLLEAFRDYSYWRRNFHPEDAPYVKTADSLQRDFQEYIEQFHSHLFEMLSHLKRSVPFFSPRYLGHMNTDLLMPGILGYISAMLYNQNNIAEEASTVTLQFESEAMQLLAKMLHLPSDSAWGHLCSGGTVANVEALWIARNLRLFPFQVALALNASDFPEDGKNRIMQLPMQNAYNNLGNIIELGKLCSITIDDINHLYQKVNSLCAENIVIAEKIEHKSIGYLGLAKFTEMCKTVLANNVPLSFKIIVNKNAHYSIKKSVGIIGLGEENLIPVQLDVNTRMDTRVLEEIVDETLAQGESIIAVVGSYGSTEEGAMDDLNAILTLRNKLRSENAGDFWVHADACYGGYALSMTHPNKDAESMSSFLKKVLISCDNTELEENDAWSVDESENWLQRSLPIGRCDSVSIDPHKLGYIPYPAGAILYKDYRVRELMKCDAPYINTEQQHKEDKNQIWNTPFPGKYTLEGSRPGAYGAAIWLAHKTIPLDTSGHGLMVAQSVLGARYLQRVIQQEFSSTKGVGCKFLCEKPDLNILCYTFPSRIANMPVSLSVVNRSVARLYRELLPTESSPTHTKEFVVAKTSLDIEEYGECLKKYINCEDATQQKEAVKPDNHLNPMSKLLKKEILSTNGNPWRDDHEIVFIRTVVMGPFLLQATTRPKMQGCSKTIASEYARFLRSRLEKIMLEILDEPIPKDKRPQLKENVLVLEDDFGTQEELTQQLKQISFKDNSNVYSARTLDEAIDIIENKNIGAALIDIDLGAIAPKGGIHFLKKAIEYKNFKGAVIFTSHNDKSLMEEITKICDLSSNTIKISYRIKPLRVRGRFQAAANEVMEDVWKILNT